MKREFTSAVRRYDGETKGEEEGKRGGIRGLIHTRGGITERRRGRTKGGRGGNGRDDSAAASKPNGVGR